MQDKYLRLIELLKQQNYPSAYLFKFIVKNDAEKVAAVLRCFDETSEVEKHPSKNGNYVALSIKEMMLSADNIIERYKQVEKIEHVMTL